MSVVLLASHRGGSSSPKQDRSRDTSDSNELHLTNSAAIVGLEMYNVGADALLVGTVFSERQSDNNKPLYNERCTLSIRSHYN